MIFRQLFDQSSGTYSYLLGCARTRRAVLLDCVFERHARDFALLNELELELVAVLDTHCHADHVTGAWLMQRALGCRVALAAVYGAKNVELPLAHGDRVEFGDEVLEVRATPGHTDGCLSFVTAGERLVFTGDALLVRGTGRTDFQQGNARRLFRSIREQLFGLPDDCAVYPAHDYDGRTSSTIGEERRYNPRIGGEVREEDFVGYLENLKLPHPKLLDVALPANLRSGEPADGRMPEEPGWAPIVTTYAGIPEIAPEWVATHREDVNVLDVRAPPELTGQLGALALVQSIPLDELRASLGEVRSDKPVVVVCQTGKRSALAATILKQAGLRVANVAGGMARWRELGLPG
jgi:glyoxylase-like metal-dependent hydrolase (beta-lactamase superfamily II)/rhodanese-related sulfurtransferase